MFHVVGMFNNVFNKPGLLCSLFFTFYFLPFPLGNLNEIKVPRNIFCLIVGCHGFFRCTLNNLTYKIIYLTWNYLCNLLLNTIIGLTVGTSSAVKCNESGLEQICPHKSLMVRRADMINLTNYTKIAI